MHNSVLISKTISLLKESEYFDIPRIMEEYIQRIWSSSCEYFVEGRERYRLATFTWDDRSKKWQDLTEEEKIDCGKRRGEIHNHNIERRRSLSENRKLFSELSMYCAKKNINLVVLVTPATKYYRKYLAKDFNKIFYEVLEEAEGTIHVVDCFENEMFDDNDDFNDTDHLNESGARKMTNLLQEVLEELS